MLFITCLFILSFCFLFYVIWSQFLKKDSRLSIGLKVLQKKMNILESFSKNTDIQLKKGIDLLDKKTKELEKIVNEARFCIFKMEKLIVGFENKDKEATENSEANSKKHNISLVQSTNKVSDKSVRSLKKSKSKFHFGDSPFSSLNFVETTSKTRKKKSFDPPPDL